MIRERFSILLIVFTTVFLISLPLIARSQVTLDVGDGSGIPGSSDNPVNVSLENLSDKVRGITVDVCDIDNYLTCTRCEITDRTPGFWCSTNELANGCVKIILASFSGEVIEKGIGPIFTLYYNVLEEAPSAGCVTLTPENEKVYNESGNSLSTFLDASQFCFLIYGDVYPRESFPDNPVCGDGIVNVYDIMEMISFVIGTVDPSGCQAVRADVPNGMPPYCDAPNGEVTISDAVVIVDKVLGKANCCEY